MSISLEQVIGFRVKITNVLDEVTEGKIYSFNSSNNTITLQTTPISRKKTQHSNLHDFKIIKCSFIKDLTVLNTEKPSFNLFRKQFIKPSFTNVERIEAMLRDSLNGANKTASNSSKVSPECQMILSAIKKTISGTRLDEEGNIIVLDALKIISPYKPENIVKLNKHLDDDSLFLVEKIVGATWNRHHHTYDKNEEDGRKGG
ncbi:hypothetical protein KAFR_0J02160 [Kazachstania africana CBS 2517]|uniref:Uncharacterized protein n=1 Tax=Kazachstania africana (strain ATCC 22294 / BCRC 22015 / CBS 2517 / CECT 1963 / NBRC 1671 / NRRL Y-8276) TaxID=1071382 RepID=H2B0Y0_KAZAF|nr:hypothetical protein KAFR_0J02160 [Kazachstania africana CBS 2517]CCF60280.1 hypothetical protein KAFR_0J02160 [Kazachstania africana CBS 2517]